MEQNLRDSLETLGVSIALVYMFGEGGGSSLYELRGKLPSVYTTETLTTERTGLSIIPLRAPGINWKIGRKSMQQETNMVKKSS